MFSQKKNKNKKPMKPQLYPKSVVYIKWKTSFIFVLFFFFFEKKAYKKNLWKN